MVIILLRLGIFVVMARRTMDEIISPDHEAKVFENFYFISRLWLEIMVGPGLVEMLVVLAFLVGF